MDDDKFSYKQQQKPNKPLPWKWIRVAILLIILIFVAVHTLYQDVEATDWQEPLVVVIYPINSLGAAEVNDYIDNLTPETFAPIQQFLQQQAERYGVHIHPIIKIVLAKAIDAMPPKQQTSAKDYNILSSIWWSLKARYWAYKHADGHNSDIRLFVIYHRYANNVKLQHSVGLSQGKFAIINAFAATKQNAQNNIVIAHELLHTLGASDKYSLRTLQPIYPDGYAEPNKEPRLPQYECEIMAGRIPQSATKAVMPNSLSQCIIGPETAHEINWW